MNPTTLHAISTLLVLAAFIGICWWAFSPKRRKRFEEAAKLPFDEELSESPQKTQQTKNEVTQS